MRYPKLIILLFTYHVIVACHVKNSQVIEDLTIKDTLSIRPSTSDTTLVGDDRFEYSSNRLKEIADRSDYKFLMLHQKGNSLSICCAWEYFSNLFGSLEKDSLLSKYKFLSVKEEKYRPLDSKQDQIINKFYYKDSFFKTYFYDYRSSNVIVCASISDKEFILRKNIQIGLLKQDFLKLLFDKTDIDYLSKFDTVNIGQDETGGLEYYYIFRDDKLDKIIIDTDFDWMDKELK